MLPMILIALAGSPLARNVTVMMLPFASSICVATFIPPPWECSSLPIRAGLRRQKLRPDRNCLTPNPPPIEHHVRKQRGWPPLHRRRPSSVYRRTLYLLAGLSCRLLCLCLCQNRVPFPNLFQCRADVLDRDFRVAFEQRRGQDVIVVCVAFRAEIARVSLRPLVCCGTKCFVRSARDLCQLARLGGLRRRRRRRC